MISPSQLMLLLLSTTLVLAVCKNDVLLGEQDRDADLNRTDADNIVDSDADHDREQDVEDADSDQLDGEADTAEADLDRDVDTEDQMTCMAGIGCVMGCADDALCAAACSDDVCQASKESFTTLSECVIPACSAICFEDFGSSVCQDCVLENCPMAALSCVNAEC